MNNKDPIVTTNL